MLPSCEEENATRNVYGPHVIPDRPIRLDPHPWEQREGRPDGRSTDEMTTAKEEMVKLIQDQPDDSSYEKILRELAFARMIDRGLADSEAGPRISSDEMQRRIDTWPQERGPTRPSGGFARSTTTSHRITLKQPSVFHGALDITRFLR